MVYISAVSNATPLIYLAKTLCLDILRKTYGQIYVCSDVWMEVIRPILYAKAIPEAKFFFGWKCPGQSFFRDPI
jgi:hypothetical protein